MGRVDFEILMHQVKCWENAECKQLRYFSTVDAVYETMFEPRFSRNEWIYQADRKAHLSHTSSFIAPPPKAWKTISISNPQPLNFLQRKRSEQLIGEGNSCSMSPCPGLRKPLIVGAILEPSGPRVRHVVTSPQGHVTWVTVAIPRTMLLLLAEPIFPPSLGWWWQNHNRNNQP